MDNSELCSRLQRAGSSGDEESALSSLLKTKLAHLRERLQAVPVQILDQVRLFVEHRLQLFDDAAILDILHDVMRTSKYATKKAATESSEAFPLAVVAATVIHRLNKGSHVWPEKVLELYLDDALGARMWVDAPESRQFVTSLLSWTTAPASNASSTNGMNNNSGSSGSSGRGAFAKMEQDGGDDSSGDEEILEDSSPRFVAAAPSSSGPFAGSHASLLELTMRALNSRINPNAGTAIVSGTWTLLVTLGELLGLAEVRSLAAAHLERWLVNPVLFERVCSLLRHMAACLALVTDPRGDRTGTGTVSLCLLPSDAAVVAEVVKMKGRIKASQFDMYKNILLAMVKRHASIAKMILMLVIQEDLLAGAHTNMLSKIQETVKLLVSLLGHLADAPGKGISKKYRTSSYILGDAVGTLCIGNAGGVADMFHMSSGGSAGHSPLFKVLLDLLVRLHRSLGISDMDQCACLRGFLAALAQSPHATSLAMQPVMCGFVAEFCVCMQLVCAHEAMVSDKESGNAGGGRGGGGLVAAGGRGGRGGAGIGPKGGRMSEKTSAIFLTAASSSSSRDRDRLAAAAAAAAAASSSAGANGGASTLSGVNKVSREALMTSCLHAQEIALQWMRDLISDTPPVARNSNSDSNNSNLGGGLPECHPSHDKSADWWIQWTHRVLLLPSSSSLSMQSHVHNKVDVDKASVLLLRDFGYISDLVLTLVCECIYQVSRNTGHISMALSILEALVHRACRTHCPGASNRNSTGEGKGWTDRGGLPGFAVLVERPESIGCLFGLCVVRPAGSKKLLQQCALPLSLVAAASQAATGESTNAIPEGATLIHTRRTDRPFPLPLPLLASRALYWRVCVVCYQLGCARPDTLGRYLWDNIPTVQTLLVMSISSRFFHPPSSMYLDARTSSTSASSVDMEIENVEPASALAYHQEGSAFVVVVTPHHVEVRPYATEDFISVNKPLIVSQITSGGEGAGATAAPQPSGRMNLLQAEEALQVLENDLWRYFFGPVPREGPQSSEYDGAAKKRRMTRALEEYAILERERQMNAEKKAKESQARAERAAKRHGSAALDPAALVLQPPSAVADLAPLAPLGIDEPPHKKPCVEATFEDDVVTLPPRFVPYSVPILTPSSYPPRSTLFETPGLGDLLFINSPVPRQAPPETIKLLRTIDAKFNFGASLRASIDPDFIVRTIYHSSSTDAQGRPEVIRETIERNSSWLISAIAVNVEVVLSRIPGTACVHLLLLTVHKVYSRLEEMGVWKDSAEVAAGWRRSILFSPRDAILAELMQEEETQSHVALLVQFIRKLLLCSEADKRDIFAAILADLHEGYHRGRVGRMALAMFSNAGQAASAISGGRIEQVLRAGPVHCDYISFFSSVGVPGSMQALQQHVQHEDATVVQGCVGKLLQIPGAEDTAVQIAAHVLTHRPDLVRALSLPLDRGGDQQQGIWQAMRVHLGTAADTGMTSLASIAHASALLSSIVFDRSTGVRSAPQDRLLALLPKEATYQLFVPTFCLFAASPAPALCAALIDVLEASVAQPAEACVMIIFAMLQPLAEAMPCSSTFLGACMPVIGSIDSSSSTGIDWGGMLGAVLTSHGKEKEKDRRRVAGMAQDFFSSLRNTAGNCSFLSWLFAQPLRPSSTPLLANMRAPLAAAAAAALSPDASTNGLQLCGPLHPLSLHETMQELVQLHRCQDQDTSVNATKDIRLVLAMLQEGAGDVQGSVDSVSRQCLAHLAELSSWIVPLITRDPDQLEAVGMLARLLQRTPETPAARDHRALAMAVAQHVWERLVLLSASSESPVGIVCASRWLLYSCYLPYPAETLAMVQASLGDETSINKSDNGSSSSSSSSTTTTTTTTKTTASKKGVTRLDTEALFHLLMLAEGESRENGFNQASQSDLAVASRGMDYLDQTADDGAALSALDRPLAFALHVLSARLPVPATLDAGTQIQALEEFDDETVRAASMVLRTAAESHPALFLRCITGIFREIQCSLKLANFASVSAGLKHKVFKPPAPASHPLWATSLGGGGGGKVQVVFRSRRCVEINECLWDGVRHALLALPGYVSVSSAGCRGEKSIHDLLRVLTQVFDHRQHLSFLPSLASSSLRDWGGVADGPSSELAFLDKMELHLHQGGQQVDVMSWGHLLVPTFL